MHPTNLGRGAGGAARFRGSVRQCNFRWWPRRSALQVSDFDAAGRRHGPLSSVHRETSTLVRFVQFARASSVPAVRNSRSIGRGVRGFKLVMVSAVSASSWRFRDAGRVHEPSIFLHPLKSSVTRAVQLASGSSDPGRSSGQRGQRCQGVQVSDGLGGQVQLRDFGRLASGNSRILV